MASRPAASNELRRQAAALFGGGVVAGLGDGELLERFVSRKASGEVEVAEAAFGALVARHARMVLGVCRRILHDPQDAEDAFQAVFLVLARKAGSIRVDDSLGKWLYGVSRRVATRARKRSDRLRSREVPSTSIDAPEPSGRPSAEAVAERNDLRAVILDELAWLPGRYREAIEACDLDGCTHEEAALRLGWPVGTVRSRLSRGRDQLRGRLTRRGIGLPAVGLPAIRGYSGSVPPALASATTHAAVRFAMRRALDGSVPIAVAALAEGVLRTMSIAKLSIAIPAALLVTGAAVATTQFPATDGGAVLPRAPKAAGSGTVAVGDAGPSQRGPAGLPPQAKNLGGGYANVVPATEYPYPFTLNFTVGSLEFQGAAKQITLQMGSMIVLESSEKDRIQIHNADSGKSATYPVPEGITASPVGTESVVALAMAGESIREVAAYSPRTDSWAVLELDPPAVDPVSPTVSGDLAAFTDGRFIYAYSARVGKWDVRKRNEGADGPPVVSKNYVLCEDEDRVYVFGAETGQWAEIEVD